MDCREFRSKHVAFVDDLLAAVDMDGMRAHLGRCPSCARQDTAVRRSLMLVRNLPSIEPSPEFMARLNARLTELGPTPRYAPRSSLFFTMPAMGTFAAVAAGIGVVAVLSMRMTHYTAPTQIASAPIAAPFDSLPDLTFANISAPEITPAGQRRVRRLRADRNSDLARGADGRRDAGPIRDHGAPAARRTLTQLVATRAGSGRRRAGLFFVGAPRGGIYSRHVARRRRKGAAHRGQGACFRAGLLLLRRRRLPQERGVAASDRRRDRSGDARLQLWSSCGAPRSTRPRSDRSRARLR